MSDLTYEQLLEENRSLKEDNSQLKQSNEKLCKSEKIYRTMFNHAGLPIVLLDGESREVILFNRKAHESLGYAENEFGTTTLRASSSHPTPRGLPRDAEIMKEYGSQTFKVIHRTKSNETIHRLITTVAVKIDGEKYFQDIWSDITDLVEMENQLENRVAERTLELQQQSENLEAMNSALSVLLKKRETDKANLEENVSKNIKELVFPYVHMLEQRDPSGQHKNLLKIIEANLSDITADFSNKLSGKLINLSPAEIKVANLIRLGQSTKEIAAQLLLSSRTIEAHRSRIRKKLGLSKNRISLQTYLSSL